MLNAALARSGPSRSRVDLTPLVQQVFANWRLLLVAFSLVFGAGLYAALMAPTTFVASSRLLVLIGSEYALRPELGIIAGDYVFSRSQIVKAEQDILASRQLHRDVVARIGVDVLYPRLADDPEAIERAAVQLGRDLVASTPEQTSLLRVSFRHASPQVAAATLTQVIEFYLERRGAVFARPQSATLAGQRDRMAERLAAAEERLVALQRDTGIVDIEQQRDALTRRLAQHEATSARLAEQIAQANAGLTRLIDGRGSLPREQELGRDDTRGPEFDNRTNTLVQLEMRRAELQARFTGQTQQMADLDRQIAELQRQFAASPLRREQAVRRGRTGAQDELDRQVALARVDLPGLIARQDEVQRQIAETRAALARLSAQAARLNDEQREVRLLTDQYTLARRRFEEAQVAEELQQRSRTTVRVIQPADVPAFGTSLKRPIVIAAFGGGIALAVLALALGGVFRQTLLDERDVERRLHLPVVVAVAERAQRRRARRRPGRRVMVVFALAALVLVASVLPLERLPIAPLVTQVTSWVSTVTTTASQWLERPAAEPATPAPAFLLPPPAPRAVPVEAAVAPPAPVVAPPVPAPVPAQTIRQVFVWLDPDPTDRWAVQVGTFRSEAAAVELGQRLTLDGHRMQRHRVVDNTAEGWFMVRVLAGPDRAQANQLADRLRAVSGVPATVIELSSRRQP